MIYIVLLLIAALLFSLQFLFTKLFQKYNGASLFSSLLLSALAYLFIALFFLIKAWIGYGEFKFGFSWFTILIVLLVAITSISCLAIGNKILTFGSMSMYSSFMMAGSIILPSLTGVLFYNEGLNIPKIIAIVLIITAVIISMEFDKKSPFKNNLYYLLVFALNGLVGVLFTIYMNHPEISAYARLVDGVLTADSDIFISWYGIMTSVVAFVVLFFLKAFKKNNLTKEKVKYGLLFSIIIACGYGLFNGMGNYFITLGTGPNSLGSAITFPLINGGTILFSTLIGAIFYKEKLNLKTIISMCLIIIATIIFAFI